MGKRKMESMKKGLYLLMAVLLPLSCSLPPKKLTGHDETSYVMAAYYIAHLAYPKDGEQFCYNFYRQDSLNGFSFIRNSLRQRDEFTDTIQSPADYHLYKDYVESMKQLASVWNSYAFGEETKILSTIFFNADHITMEETEAHIVIYDKQKNIKIYAEKFQTWANDYVNNKCSYSEAFEKLGHAQKMECVHVYYNMLNFYTHDSLYLDIKNEKEIRKYYGEKLYKRMNTYYNKSMKLQSFNYYRNKRFVNSQGDPSFIKKVEADTIVTNALDSIMMEDERIAFIKFHCH